MVARLRSQHRGLDSRRVSLDGCRAYATSGRSTVRVWLQHATHPAWRLRGKERAGVPEPGQHSPGAIYDPPPPLGKPQVDAQKPSAPKMSFNKFSRWAGHEKELATNSVPGPGHYG